MLILALESSGETASAALVTEGKVLAEINCAFGPMRANYAKAVRKTHSETLMPMVEFIFKTSGVFLPEIDYIALSAGPGSFTGLRIGAAAAKALCHGADKPLIPVPTLDALAINVSGYPVVAPVMDARRGQVYACVYERTNGRLTKLTPYMAEDLEVILQTAAGYGKDVCFLGDAASVFYDKITAYKNFYIAPEHLRLQRAASVGLLALNLTETAVGYEANPLLYLRKPQAERAAYE